MAGISKFKVSNAASLVLMKNSILIQVINYGTQLQKNNHFLKLDFRTKFLREIVQISL